MYMRSTWVHNNTTTVPHQWQGMVMPRQLRQATTWPTSMSHDDHSIWQTRMTQVHNDMMTVPHQWQGTMMWCHNDNNKPQWLCHINDRGQQLMVGLDNDDMGSRHICVSSTWYVFFISFLLVLISICSKTMCKGTSKMRPPLPPVAMQQQQQQRVKMKMWHDDEVEEGGMMTRWHNVGPNDACTHVWAYVYL